MTEISNIEIAIIAVIASFGVVTVIWGLVLANLARILAKRERRRMERITKEEECKSTYLEQCGYDPKECEECHLPGDCSLCGAR